MFGRVRSKERHALDFRFVDHDEWVVAQPDAG